MLSDDEYAAAVTPPARAIIEVDARDKKQRPVVNVHYGVALPDHPELDPAVFAASTDTLYALSMEGADSASALTTTLVGQIFDAAAALARRPRPACTNKTPQGSSSASSYDGQDERWAPRDPAGRGPRRGHQHSATQSLPDQYSHFGGRGIIPIAILQSPQQGTACGARRVRGNARRFGPLLRRQRQGPQVSVGPV
ncbi:hypothetical protein GS493_23390 [Rhodococcus hoagii]|nr:hypothetical protein [Prescottella equi]